ncbi:MAG: Lrp/AsnC family transcriptional regulator [Alphaproteobacteria bacterium]|nr:Lrp/AsnC family transcriptional regulator [Alphaproteobacteria bacterium]MBV9694671.1 Lrp/AsnC family transcriptional regulator [Alphaproteobacteria bacterium]
MTFPDADRRILRLLQREGRISVSELARRTGMAESSCLRRIRQLEEAGVITGYRAVVDQRKVNLPISAIVMVATNQRTETDRELFLDAIAKEPEVLTCAAISGSHDFLLEIAVADIDALSELTLRKLLGLPTVMSLSSSIVYRWIKRSEPLPV